MSGIDNLRSMIGVVAIVAVLNSAAISRCYAAISCAQVTNELAPCLEYIRGAASGFDDQYEKPSPECCDGAKNLIDNAKTKQDVEASCECIKKNLSMIGDYDSDRVSMLPGDCEIDAEFPPITNTTDCSKFEIWRCEDCYKH